MHRLSVPSVPSGARPFGSRSPESRVPGWGRQQRRDVVPRRAPVLERIVGTGRGWTAGFWNCTGCTLVRVPKVPEEGISPDPPRGRDRQWGRGRTEGRGRAQPGRQPGAAGAPCEEAPAPLPVSRSPLLLWTSALYICPHLLTSCPTSSPFAGCPCSSHLSPPGSWGRQS